MADNLRVAMDMPLDQIKVGERVRPISEATVAALLHVIGEHGFTVPILVRKYKDRFELIDGAHRLEAMRRRGDVIIPAMVAYCSQQEAKALEVTQNLAGAAMSPLDDALFLAAYSAAYEELHPETRRGAASVLARQGIQTELSSFCDIIADKRSITSRQVRKIVAAGRNISRSDADLLRSAERKASLKDIVDIGKIGDADERASVVLRLASGNAKSAAAAISSLKAEKAGVQPLIKDKVDVAFNALMAIWNRAPKAAKKRFCFEAAKEIWEIQNKGVSLKDWSEASDE